ncbi:discoidin domain-containing protein [Streptomyces sp. AK02-04a]|uniref:discoidin domain-containing protein n=1 Tax=Streptomyces sp. AK02-04a TaxID=3028649 RepID=UPI0029B7E51F|nr:discoidin domain-containing protein [Streptomyces sp. AK02-04a]MDX3763026.1 discoidin domain-containing protein [Streptomyces sp. AK02-04a]
MFHELRCTRRTQSLAAAVAAAALLLPPVALSPAQASQRSGPAASTRCAPQDRTWSPTATSFDPNGAHHAYVGNGYLGARVPPAGAGYAAPGGKTGWPLYTPRYDGAFAAGLYSQGPKNTAGREAIAALPTWTGLDAILAVKGPNGMENRETYGPGSRITHYNQTLLLRCGLVRTSLTWTASDGRRTDLTYEVLADRTDPHAAAVHLTLSPHWSGPLKVTDRIDGRGARRIAPVNGDARREGGMHGMDVAFRTDGTGVTGAVATVLRSPGRAGEPRSAGPLSARQSAVLRVRAGHTYEVTKYVGVDTSLTSNAPEDAAQAAALRAAQRGWPALLAAHTAAWQALWSSDVEVPGRPDLQLWVRAARYGLLSALRPGAGDSVAPAGLTSDDYAGMVFWDAETWMFPGLLATRPDFARSILEYRYRTRAAAADNARRTSVSGLFYPWTSTSRGQLWSECQSWNPPHCVTQDHLQGDIALAVWQYYLATGDSASLRSRGWPMLRGLAEYWVSRVTPNPDGSNSIKGVAGPDEYSNGVTDGVYTNAVAATALRAAARAAEVLHVSGAPTDVWRRTADTLRIPYDPKRKIFLQYAGYDGSQIKQADTVLLMYPLEWPMPASAAAATLDYYTERTDPDGPAMTDSVHAIDAAAIGEPGCATYTFLQRAGRPFFRDPFALFSEARGSKAGAGDALAGSPAQDFLTGKGGFLQVFTHGLTGLRLRDGDFVHLDPTLPPQLAPQGVRVSGLQWRGRTYDVEIGPRTTTVRLVAGAPFTVDSPEGRFTLAKGAPVSLKTRRPDLVPTSDLARCRPVTSTSEEPGLYAEAAVDGDQATAWRPGRAGESLTVDLGRSVRISRVQVAGTHEYRLQVSADRTHWAPYDGKPVTARHVRITVTGATPGEVKEVTVSSLP